MSSSRSEQFTLLGFRLGWRAVRLMPRPLAYRTFQQVADLAYRRGGKQVDRLRSNYAKVRPELSPAELNRLTRDGMRSYLRYWCDAFRMPDWSREEIVDRIRVVGDLPVRQSIAEGRGWVGFLGHLGNWDHAGAWARVDIGPLTTVAERLRPEELYEKFVSYRASIGITILPLTGGSNTFGRLARAVRENQLVPLLADRDLTDKGVDVDLLGHRTRMAAGPAALSLVTGAPLQVVTMSYEPHPGHRRGPGGYRSVVTFSPVLTSNATTRTEQIRDLTQQCADHLGETIRSHTEDWHMLQRVFLDDLEPRDDPIPRDDAPPAEPVESAEPGGLD